LRRIVHSTVAVKMLPTGLWEMKTGAPEKSTIVKNVIHRHSGLQHQTRSRMYQRDISPCPRNSSDFIAPGLPFISALKTVNLKLTRNAGCGRRITNINKGMINMSVLRLNRTKRQKENIKQVVLRNTSWSSVVPVKPILSLLITKFPSFHGILWYIAVFERAH
jgi:hypothetical protein